MAKGEQQEKTLRGFRSFGGRAIGMIVIWWASNWDDGDFVKLVETCKKADTRVREERTTTRA